MIVSFIYLTFTHVVYSPTNATLISASINEKHRHHSFLQVPQSNNKQMPSRTCTMLVAYPAKIYQKIDEEPSTELTYKNACTNSLGYTIHTKNAREQSEPSRALQYRKSHRKLKLKRRRRTSKRQSTSTAQERRMLCGAYYYIHFSAAACYQNKPVHLLTIVFQLIIPQIT